MQLDRPLLVLSPHLDDAVLACGELLGRHPGSIVATIFAGMPTDRDRCTEWDAASGYESAGQAITARRAEDRSALARLGAMPRWLDFADAQYGETPGEATLAESIEALVEDERPGTVLMPLGLFHSDHVLTHLAALHVLRRRPAAPAWVGYEDALYRRLDGVLQQRLAALIAAGITATPENVPRGDATLKARAMRCYASQLRALATPGRPGHADSGEPERYWRLRPAGESAGGR